MTDAPPPPPPPLPLDKTHIFEPLVIEDDRCPSHQLRHVGLVHGLFLVVFRQRHGTVVNYLMWIESEREGVVV